ncbi:MAG: hypothetical protein HYV28_08630 [Ignavibacteriales bacterium]|nr:hypothetical protein [Ignavibacteriales bacterium]
MKKFKITSVYSGSKTEIYSVQIDGSEKSEFEKFIERFSETHRSDVNYLADTVQKIADIFGIREQFFKPQGLDGVYRFIMHRDKKTSLRLYCIKWGSELLIIGGGGIKEVRTWQESHELSKIVRELSKIDKYLLDNKIDIKNAVKSNEIFDEGI